MEVGDGGGGKICSLLFRVMMFTVDDITTHRRKTLFQAFNNNRHKSSNSRSEQIDALFICSIQSDVSSKANS
jgi:hypothetical protein